MGSGWGKGQGWGKGHEDDDGDITRAIKLYLVIDRLAVSRPTHLPSQRTNVQWTAEGDLEGW